MEKRLVVKLDQYAGNVDELVSVALTGFGNDRYGAKEAKKIYKEKVAPLVNEDEFPLDFYDFATEYGDSMYELDTNCDNLRLGIDWVSNISDIDEAISIWEKAYMNAEGVIEISIPMSDHKGGFKNKVIKILGFDLIEIKEERTTLR